MKYLKMSIILIIGILILLGIIFISKFFNEKETSSVFSAEFGKTDMNTIWVGTFQIAWNELMEHINGNIEFEDGNSELATQLNNRTFTKDMISKKDYYIAQGNTTKELKKTILSDLKNQFNIENTRVLDGFDFEYRKNSYTIYSVLNKNFTFSKPFDKLPDGGTTFNGGNKNIQLFGINNSSSEELNNNLKVMFFNSSNEFAIRINTIENEELILYRTNSKSSFEDLFNEVLIKEENYTGNKRFKEVDELRIPYIELDKTINYDELCNRQIKNTNGMYIQNAIQNIKFSLTEKGGNLISDAKLTSTFLSESMETRKFNFTNSFILFIKEKDKDKPYFVLRVDNDDILKKLEI